jgi:hypothetical protein
MPADTLAALTSAVAPVVMVSAAGLLFNGIQAKNLHLADRIRALMAEFRNEATPAARRAQVTEQLRLFHRRIRLSQWSLDMIYVSIICFIVTSLLLASALWLGPGTVPVPIVVIFATGVAVLVLALVLEFIEMLVALETIHIEMRDADASVRE